MPVELTGGVEDIDTASVEIGPVGAVVGVIVSVVVMGVTASCWEVSGPPFSNDTHSATNSGSLTVFSLSFKGCSTCDGVLSPIGRFDSGVASILSSHWSLIGVSGRFSIVPSTLISCTDGTTDCFS